MKQFRRFASVGFLFVISSFSISCSGPSNNATSTSSSSGALQFGASAYPVAQNAGSMMMSVIRTGGSSGAVSIAYGTNDGTASSGTDYTAVNGTLSWSAGDSAAKTFSVPVGNNNPFPGTRTLTVSLSSPSGGATLGTPNTSTITITGDAVPTSGIAVLSATSYSVAQVDGSLTVTVDRTGGSSGVASIAYATSNGTAIAGADYMAANGTLSWADGDATPKTVNIAISKITPFSGSRMFNVTLSNPSAVALGTPGSATVTIKGDAVASPGTLALSAANYVATQPAGMVAVAVNRTGGSAGVASVAYATHDGTAIAGMDYAAANGTLVWADGDATPKMLMIAISNTTPFSGSRSLSIALANVSDATLGTPSSATIEIDGDAILSPGTLVLSAASFAVAQSAGTVSVTVGRNGGSAGAVSVVYATSNGTATAGTDYTPATGMLAWADGDVSPKSFSIAISEATLFSGSKAFSVALSSPNGGSTLGTPGKASIVITGSSGSGQRGPAAVTNLQLVNQGGLGDSANVPTPATNTQQINWVAASPGDNPVSFYKIYRNGVAYDTTTSLTYTDKNAPNSNSPTWTSPAAIYSYQVSAVDTKGIGSPQAAQMSVYAYRNGYSNWANSDLSFGTLTENYADIKGSPQGGPFDISVNFINGGFQPTAGPPQAPNWDLELGAFKYYIVDVNPGPTVGYTLKAGTVSRVPPGDVYGWGPLVNVFDYGPAPIPNTWATYKIPLTAFNMGTCQFTGSITGTTLTVTAITSGPRIVDSAGFVTGPGVPEGTYILAYGQANAIGTFTVAGPGINSSTSVPTTTMTYQRTALYKTALFPSTSNTQIYFNNLGWTAN